MVGRLGVVMLAICPLGCFIPKDIEIDDFTGTGDFPWTDTLPATITVSTSIDTIESITATDSATSTTSGHHPSDTSGDGTETETDTDGPDSVCDPQPEDVESGVLVDGTPSWEHDHTELDVSCVVTFVGNFGPALHLGLACDDGAHTLDVSDIGGIDVAVGDIVDLSLYIDVPFWSNVYVAVRKDGELVLAALDADSLPGEEDDGGHPPHDFFAPLDLIVLHEVCEEEPPEPEPCHFVCHDPCTRDRRLAITFVDDGEAEVVFDHGSGQAGDLAIVVGHAVEHVEVSCTDTPGWRFGFVALRD